MVTTLLQTWILLRVARSYLFTEFQDEHAKPMEGDMTLLHSIVFLPSYIPQVSLLYALLSEPTEINHQLQLILATFHTNIHYSKKFKEYFDIMIFIERYPLKRCQGCVKLIASKVNCFLNINDLSEVQLCIHVL